MKFEGVTVYNKNPHVPIQWLVHIKESRTSSHCWIGPRGSINDIFSLIPCDVCSFKIKCALINKRLIVQFHSAATRKPLEKIPFNELIANDDKNISYIYCSSFCPLEGSLEDLKIKYGFKIF